MLRRLFVVVMSMTLGLMAGLVLTGRMRTASARWFGPGWAATSTSRRRLRGEPAS